MSTEAEEIQRRVRDGVRETISAYRIQARTGPITDDALDQILSRGSHQIIESLSPYPLEQRYALLRNVVRMMLAAFLEFFGPRGSRTQMTEDELRDFSTDHLFYELEMVFETGPLALAYADPKTPVEQVIKNALLDSFTIHCRVLKAFFYDVPIRPDDVTADDYVTDPAEWRRARGEVPEILRRAASRTGGEIAHLTRRRQTDPEKKQWTPQEITQALAQPLRIFVEHTSKGRLDWRIRVMAGHLAGPGAGPDGGDKA